MRILVFGGAGYIGSHTCVELAARGHDLVVADNLCNSSAVVLDRLQAITGAPVEFRNVDLRDRDATAAELLHRLSATTRSWPRAASSTQVWLPM